MGFILTLYCIKHKAEELENSLNLGGKVRVWVGLGG